MTKHFFFDLDKTLTKSRSSMETSHQGLFLKLCDTADVIVVTGGTIEHIREQVTSHFDNRYLVLAQSGNHAVDDAGMELWYEPLDDVQEKAVRSFIDDLKQHFNESVRDENDLIEHRGAQIGYSVIGYHEDAEKKYAFDPGDSRRRAALLAFPEHIENMRMIDIEVVPAGTTSFNFYALGRHKGHNIARLIEYKGWKKQDSIYIGDALFPGGNDETVIGVIPTHSVKDPDETFAFVAEVLSKL